MASKAQKIRLGVFAIVAAALVLVVVISFGGLYLWQDRERYHIVFDDTVFGLQEGAEVLFAGIRVGRVQRIEIDPDDLRKIRVTIDVKPGLPIRADTAAVLSYKGITGLKVVDLRGGDVTAPRLRPGSEIAVGDTTLDVLERQASELAQQSKQIMSRANLVVTNLATLTDPAKFAGLEEMIADGRVAAAHLARASGELDGMIAENRIALRGAITATDQAARRASGLVDDMRGVVRNNESQLATAMADLRQASRSFKELARELRHRPSRLLFSQAPRDRKLP